MVVEAKIQLEIVQLRAAYELGKRNFQNIQLPKADLRGITLRGADLRGANLAGADLREANLERTDLRGADLRGANLSKARLQQANLAGANFKSVYFTRAELKEADFSGADLEKTHLNEADLEKAILNRANLQGAFLIGADLTRAKFAAANLGEAWLVGVNGHSADLAGAFYNARTRFDEDFSPDDSGMKPFVHATIEEILPILEYIYRSACKYLGKTIAGRYWCDTCPREIWLERFSPTSRDEIDFTGDRSEEIGYLQLQECREWMDRFVHRCGSIVRDFTLQLKRGNGELKLYRLLDL